MSYEYLLVLDENVSAQNFVNSLARSEACVKAQGREVYLKDQELRTSNEYDVRLIQEGNQSMWIEINLKSLNLYRLFCSSLNGAIARCYEDGDLNDEISLKEAFRIKVEE